MKHIKYLFLIISVTFIISCDYKEYETEYSAVYPLCGEFYVRDFDINADGTIKTDSIINDWYLFYIYNTATNKSGSEVWIDNSDHNALNDDYTESYYYKVRTEADLTNFTFDCSQLAGVVGINAMPSDTPKVYISISQSKMEVKDWPTPDSISFKIIFFDKDKIAYDTIFTAGHRKTGWEFPEYNDNM